MDLLKQIQELQDYYDKNQKLNDKYLKQFSLAGYELYTEPDDGKSRPKELEELIAEVLQHPPEKPQDWIRIADIPRYIADYLIVPRGEELERFNQTQYPRKNGLVIPPEENKSKEPEKPTMVDDKGSVVDYEFTGKEWIKTGQIPEKITFVDSLGTVWYKVANNQIIDVATFDEQAPDYSNNAEVSQFPPLREIRYDD